MKTVLSIFRFAILISIASFLVGSLASAQNDSAPVNLSFYKCDVTEANLEADFVWHGTVSGDINGDLMTQPTSVDDSQPIWQVEFNFSIDADDPSKDMTIHLKGTLNTNTGQVVMNGEVAEGYLLGAQVHEMGQLVDAEKSCFEGTIRINPRTAD